MTATNRIIEELYDAPSYSRELSDRLGVRFKTVSQVLTVLRRRGIVEQLGNVPRGPGRPMSLYGLARTKRTRANQQTAAGNGHRIQVAPKLVAQDSKPEKRSQSDPAQPERHP